MTVGRLLQPRRPPRKMVSPGPHGAATRDEGRLRSFRCQAERRSRPRREEGGRAQARSRAQWHRCCSMCHHLGTGDRRPGTRSAPRARSSWQPQARRARACSARGETSYGNEETKPRTSRRGEWPADGKQTGVDRARSCVNVRRDWPTLIILASAVATCHCLGTARDREMEKRVLYDSNMCRRRPE